MKLGMSFGHGLTPSEVVAGARFAEKVGFTSVWVSESTGYDSLSILGAIASQSQKIDLASGIANVYSRSATQLAMAASTIDELSAGRFTLGVGVSSKSVISKWHGMDYTNQLSKMRSAVEEIKMKLGQPLIPSFHHRSDRIVPIIIAAVHDKMVLLAKEIADGVLFFLRPFSGLSRDVEALSGKKFSVHASVVCCVSKDHRIALERVRRTIGFYLVYGKSYEDFIRRNTSLSGDTTKAIKELWISGKREDAARLVPLDVIDQVAIYGTPNECRKRIQELHSSLKSLSTLSLQFNPGEKSTSESFESLRPIAQDIDSPGKVNRQEVSNLNCERLR